MGWEEFSDYWRSKKYNKKDVAEYWKTCAVQKGSKAMSALEPKWREKAKAGGAELLAEAANDPARRLCERKEAKASESAQEPKMKAKAKAGGEKPLAETAEYV